MKNNRSIALKAQRIQIRINLQSHIYVHHSATAGNQRKKLTAEDLKITFKGTDFSTATMEAK